MGLYFPKLQWKCTVPRQKASLWSITRCWKPVVFLFNHNFINRVSGVRVQKWDGLQGAESGAWMEEEHQPQGEHSQIFPVLYHTWKFSGNLSALQLLFSLLFFSCFIHVLHGTGFISSTAWYHLPCPGSGCERFGSPETAGIAEKIQHLFQGWACSLWSLRRRLPQAGWCQCWLAECWHLGWGRTGRLYMTSVLFKVTWISSPYFLSLMVIP